MRYACDYTAVNSKYTRTLRYEYTDLCYPFASNVGDVLGRVQSNKQIQTICKQYTIIINKIPTQSVEYKDTYQAFNLLGFTKGDL